MYLSSLGSTSRSLISRPPSERQKNGAFKKIEEFRKAGATLLNAAALTAIDRAQCPHEIFQESPDT
jgi:hypothetical protein